MKRARRWRWSSRQPGARDLERPLGIALLLLALLTLVGADAPTQLEEFYPLKVGNRWTYSIQRDRTVAPVGEAQERRVFSGHMASEILGNQQQGRRSLQVLRMTTTGLRDSGGEKERSQRVQLLSWDAGGLMLFVDKELDEGMAAAVRTPKRPQLRLLDRKLETGHRWRAGTLNIGQVEVRLEAHVVGQEDVKIEDDFFEGCLRVRYEGPADGWVDSPAGPARIGWGRYEQEVWYARGVGVVQTVYRMRGEMVLPGSTLARFDEVERRRLETHVLR